MASQPVVFLEQDVRSPLGNRLGRFWAAFGLATAYYPLLIVDSGHQVTSGYSYDLYSRYQNMVLAELPRPPQAELQLFTWQTGNRIHFFAKATNLTGTALSATRNGASFSALVYEDIHYGVTSRFVRAVVDRPVSSEMAPGGTAAFSGQTPELTSVDWARTHTVGLIDYRPAGNTGPYDMLQAVRGLAPTLTLHPRELVFLVSPDSAQVPPQAVALEGPAVFSWTASWTAPWIAVSPASGPMSAAPSVTVLSAALSPGWQAAQVTMTASDGDGFSLTQVLEVRALLTGLSRVYLPLLAR